MSKNLVLGVGNTLLSDEGAGVHAMHYLQTHAPDLVDTEFLDAGTLSFTLADDIASATNLIIFDAAQLDAEAGTVQVFENDELDNFLRFGRRSVHEGLPAAQPGADWYSARQPGLGRACWRSGTGGVPHCS